MQVREACFFGKDCFLMLVYIALCSNVLKNRDDDEYYAPMIFRLTHEIIITFEHCLVLVNIKDMFIKYQPVNTNNDTE